MAEHWLSTDFETLGLIALTAVVMYGSILLLTRLVGLRSFAQMSAFDFAMSVAIGTLFASTIVSGAVSLTEGAFGLACLFGLQVFIGSARQRSSRFAKAVDNQPMLLMDGPEIIAGNMADGRVTEADLRSKLRESNVRNHDEVLAVVLETTGDVTVLHAGASEEVSLDRSLLSGVIGRDGEPLD